ncbi:MAG: hypothetical protein KAI72_07355, partial [Candidatus Pacebacteria bacterium]|nr:hypothetical protein [Candidatus Paceibacterota bacterium]
MVVTQRILEEVGRAIKLAYGTEPQEQLLLGVPPDPKLGDFAIPTFLLKKQFGENPKDIAEKIAKN